MYRPDRPLSHEPIAVLRSWRSLTFIKDYTYKFFLKHHRLPQLHPYVIMIRLRPRKK